MAGLIGAADGCRPERRRSRALVAAGGAAICALSVFGGACIDFGELPQPDASQDAAAADAAEPDAGATCVEGRVEPELAENTINIVRFSLDPLEMTIAANSVVKFMNTDSRNHRLLAGTPDAPLAPADGGFNSGLLAPGDAYGHRFCTPRALLYYCSSHPGTMNGYRIVIE